MWLDMDGSYFFSVEFPAPCGTDLRKPLTAQVARTTPHHEMALMNGEDQGIIAKSLLTCMQFTPT
jgi:hypothetical protein